MSNSIADSVYDILCKLTTTSDREGLKETPNRVAKYLREMTEGYEIRDIDILLKSFADGADDCDEMIFEGAIPFFSTCEHHMVPFFGVAHIGYIPNGKIVGLSKIPRLVDVFAHRLQVQERLTNEIANALFTYLNPKGVGVVLRARHLCVESRGIRKPGTVTYTSALRGCMKDVGGAREEFLRFMQLADQKVSSI